MPKNMNMISGTKPSTPPTPSMMPEMISDFSRPSGRAASATPPSQPNRFSIQATGISL